MKKIIATQDDCWDTIAYKTYNDEFYFEQIMQANWRLSDVVMFAGGERVIIPDEIEVDNRLIASPWQTGTQVTIIKSPWG